MEIIIVFTYILGQAIVAFYLLYTMGDIFYNDKKYTFQAILLILTSWVGVIGIVWAEIEEWYQNHYPKKRN
jgi:hypothetical protein